MIEELQGKSDFANVGVAGALAHAVDGALDPIGAAADGGNGGGCRQAHIIVAVPVYRHRFSHPRSDLTHKQLDCFGRANTDRIDDGDFIGAGPSRAVDVAQERKIASGAVYGEELTRSIPLSFAYLMESTTLFMTFSRVKPNAFIFMSLVVISSSV